MSQLYGESSNNKRSRTRVSKLFKAYVYNQDTGKAVEESVIPEDLQYHIDIQIHKRIIEWIKEECGVNQYGGACGQFSDMWLDCYSDYQYIDDPPNVVFRFKDVNYIIYWSDNQS
jgi:hypothetical protein